LVNIRLVDGLLPVDQRRVPARLATAFALLDEGLDPWVPGRRKWVCMSMMN